MLLLSLSAIVLMVSLESSQGFYTGIGGPRRSSSLRMPMCPSWNKPCRLRARMGNINGSEIETNSAETCTCSPQHGSCSSDWSKPRHVVARKVVASAYNITLEMMFCRPVEPRRFCRRYDTALVLKGSMAIPIDIVSYNCQCRRRQPLVLHRREYGDDHLVHHTYKCANHVSYCSRRDPCLTIHHTHTAYLCKCGSRRYCDTDAFQFGHHGYCRLPEEV